MTDEELLESILKKYNIYLNPKYENQLIKRITNDPNIEDLIEYKKNYLSNNDIIVRRFKNNKLILDILGIKEVKELTPKELYKFMFKYNEVLDYKYEKEEIDKILKNAKNGIIETLPKENAIKTIVDNDIDASIVCGCLLAKLKDEYNIDFDINIHNFYDKKELLNENMTYDEIGIKFIDYDEDKTGNYKNTTNEINIYLSKVLKDYINYPKKSDSKILAIVYHEFHHAYIETKKNKKSYEGYILEKNDLLIEKNYSKYLEYHNYLEVERMANNFAYNRLLEDFGIEDEFFKEVSKTYYSYKYDYINSLGKTRLDELSIKQLKKMKNKELAYSIIMNKKLKFFNLFDKEELLFIKEAYTYSKNKQFERIMNLVNEDPKLFNKSFNYCMKKYIKTLNILKKL